MFAGTRPIPIAEQWKLIPRPRARSAALMTAVFPAKSLITLFWRGRCLLFYPSRTPVAGAKECIRKGRMIFIRLSRGLYGGPLYQMFAECGSLCLFRVLYGGQWPLNAQVDTESGHGVRCDLIFLVDKMQSVLIEIENFGQF